MKKAKRFIARVVLIAILICLALLAVDFIRYPECYSSTMRYQLQNDIKRGDALALEYYQNTYIASGRALFE